MRIESIAINNLFGYYTYDINLDNQDSLFIITGLNGFGKTTVMKILDNLSQGKLHYFYNLPFDSIKIRIDNEQDPLGVSMTLLITKKTIKDNLVPEKGGNQPDTNVKPEQNVVFQCFALDNGTEKKLSEAVLSKKQEPVFRSYYSFNEIRPFYDDARTFNYPNVDRHFNIETRKIKNKKGFPFDIYSKTLKVKFIEAQRLLISEQDEEGEQITSKPTIKDVASKLEDHLKKARYEFLDESQRKSNNLIDTLLNSTDEGMSEEDYNKEMEELIPTVNELKSYNLASENLIPYKESKKGILSVYIKDQKAKLEVFSDVLRELNLFSMLLEKKRFSHKKITFSPQYGLKAYTDHGDPIDLENLSSGEQNEIIILYKLIFDVPSDTILLIDEPEISLHVIWQEEFMEDLEEIARTRRQQMIIATHSPQIIGNRWKQCYDLTERNLKR